MEQEVIEGPSGRMTGRFEVIARVSGRRFWTVEQKLAILRDAFGPGGSVRSAMERHDVTSGGLLYTWRRMAMSGLLLDRYKVAPVRTASVASRPVPALGSRTMSSPPIRARSWANNASGAGVENCCRETCSSLRTVCVGSELHKVSNASRHGGPELSLRCNRSATAHSSISKAARIGTSAPFDEFEVFFRCVSKDARDVIVSRAGSSVIAAVARESWCMGISINSD